jgi:xylan 1,4-beta-xylosidase
MPERLSAAQLRRLKALTADRPEQARVVRVGASRSVTVSLPMRTNDVVLVTLEPR